MKIRALWREESPHPTLSALSAGAVRRPGARISGKAGFHVFGCALLGFLASALWSSVAGGSSGTLAGTASPGWMAGISCGKDGTPNGGVRLSRVIDEGLGEDFAREPEGDAEGPQDGTRQDRVGSGAEPQDSLRRFRVSWPATGGEPLAAADRPVLGGEVRILRCMTQGRWEVVGEGRTLGMNGESVEASVRLPGGNAPRDPDGLVSLQSSVRGNHYPRPMSGDVVVPVIREARLRPRVTPRVTLDGSSLFASDALTDSGREILAAEVAKFLGVNGRILVESHMTTPGERRSLRERSRMRAVAVAQFMARELGVSSERIVPLGFGSDGLTLGMHEVPRWPEGNAEERIVLRVLPSGK
jgi:hypothetical protein